MLIFWSTKFLKAFVFVFSFQIFTSICWRQQELYFNRYALWYNIGGQFLLIHIVTILVMSDRL